MLEEFYRMPEPTDAWRALRSDGYLGDARVRRPDGHWVLMESLPPLVRTLLATDGTVTKVLEAFFWEPVNVCALHLDVTRTEKPIAWLNLDSGEEVLTRQVQLKGEHSDRLYTEAFSVINLGEFDSSIREALVQGRVGIGVLLRESGLETYREIMAVGMEYGPGHTEPEQQDIWVYRIYRITRDKKPVILIRESFPLRLYDLPNN
jgi:chorismate-pyruvate lyase